MQAALQKRHKTIIILLALLINFLLLLPLILMKIDEAQEAFVTFQDDPESTLMQQEAKPDPEELIEYILSSGAAVPTTEQEIQDDMAPQENPMLAQAQPGTQVEEEAAEKPIVEEEPQEENKGEPEAQLPDKVINKEAIVEEQMQPQEQPQKQAMPPETAVSMQEDTHQVEQKIEMPEKIEPEKKEVVQPLPRPKIKPRPKPTQQKESFGLSLGQISQGFMKSVQQEEGLNNPPQMDADKLVAHQYATKVWNIIKNSFRSDPNMLHLSQNINTMAYLVITITKNGKLVDIHLEGNKVNSAFKQIEAMIVSHAKAAGLFPPLPKRFDVPQKTFTFPLHVQGQEGFHSYRLSYGPNR